MLFGIPVLFLFNCIVSTHYPWKMLLLSCSLYVFSCFVEESFPEHISHRVTAVIEIRKHQHSVIWSAKWQPYYFYFFSRCKEKTHKAWCGGSVIGPWTWLICAFNLQLGHVLWHKIISIPILIYFINRCGLSNLSTLLSVGCFYHDVESAINIRMTLLCFLVCVKKYLFIEVMREEVHGT